VRQYSFSQSHFTLEKWAQRQLIGPRFEIVKKEDGPIYALIPLGLYAGTAASGELPADLRYRFRFWLN